MNLPRYDVPPAIVLGLGQNGMATCRALGAGIVIASQDTQNALPHWLRHKASYVRRIC